MKDETIKLLEGQKQTFIASKLYAEMRIDRMGGDSTYNTDDTRVLNDMIQQKKRCEDKIIEIEACIKWLFELKVNPLSNENNINPGNHIGV